MKFEEIIREDQKSDAEQIVDLLKGEREAAKRSAKAASAKDNKDALKKYQERFRFVDILVQKATMILNKK